MKKIITYLFILFLMISCSYAINSILIDDFNSKVLTNWWTFDCNPKLDKGNLEFNGQSKNWYAGGVGTYIAKENHDLSQFNALQIDIIGNGLNSGNLKIELIDDDNNNWDYEQDSSKNYIPTKDDRFVFEQRIDWSGLKTVIIPFLSFNDDNPLIGNDKLDIEQKNGSGGLLQFQFICLGNKQSGKINFSIDNIYLIKE